MRAETFPPQVGVAWDQEEAQRFLEALDPSASRFTFQMLNDSGKAAPPVRHCTIGELWPEVQRWNSPAAVGVFVTINESDLKGRRTSNIVRARAVFVDADGQEAMNRCRAFIESSGANPSAVVSTSPSKAHFYWCVDDLALSDFSALQETLIGKLGTDSAVKDLPRLMRLPGTLHLKNPGAPYKVSLLTCGPRWQLSSLLRIMNLSGVTTQGYASSWLEHHPSCSNRRGIPESDEE